MQKQKIKTGDVIRCTDQDDMIETMTQLARLDIETDFVYEIAGREGFWLIVTKGAENGN